MRPVCLLMIFLLFTLLYLIILIKDKLIEKSFEREGSLYITLHVTTETQFLLRKTLKNIMHGHVKMYVMRCLFVGQHFIRFGPKL